MEQRKSEASERIKVEYWPRERLRVHAETALVPALADAEFGALREDIASQGVLDPLHVTAVGVVLDGRSRLRAAAELGLEQLPVQIVAPEDEREYMLLRVLRRLHLSSSRKAALALELEDYRPLRAEAKQRQLGNLRGQSEVASSPPRGERTRALVARLAGCSPRVVQDAATVLEADPELFAKIRDGELPAHVAAQRVRRASRYAAIAAAPPLPNGQYELVYVDPAWQLGNPSGAYAPEQHYPTTPLPEIKALALPAARDAGLFLWAVNCLLPEALEVMQAWGFEYKTNFVWDKGSIGLGTWARNQHELLLFGRRGNFPPPPPEQRQSSVIHAPRGRHSQKPADAYQLIERMYPHATKLELFARGKPRPGWAAWCNEVEP
jgi:N6-adenosine-specific RNA methylase IME4